MTDTTYGKPSRPFELWNIGNYETVYWQEKQDEYLAFMLKLYQAEHKYDSTREYQIMVKVVDVFGNDTNKVMKVKIK